MFDEPGTARQEAEKLVAAVMAAATLAAHANPHWSTGSSECCVCPLCKVIAAVRDPDPAVVERLATGAGDLAAGVASFLRHAAASASTSTSDTWSAATAAGAGRDAEPSPPQTGRGAATGAAGPAKKVVKKTVKKAAATKAVKTVKKAVPPKKKPG